MEQLPLSQCMGLEMIDSKLLKKNLSVKKNHDCVCSDVILMDLKNTLSTAVHRHGLY